MRIAIDIDDTMTNTTELIEEYAKKYFNTYTSEQISDIFNAHKFEGELLDFYNKYLAEMMTKYALKDNVKEVLHKLKENGHQLIVITARATSINKIEIIQATYNYFNKHNLKFDQIIFGTPQKLIKCIENKIDVIIDDSINDLEIISANGIDTLLFTSTKNKNKETLLKRVNNWLEIESYIVELQKHHKKTS